MLTDVRPTRREAPARHRRLDVQGLRAVAIILVVAFHAGLPVPGGFIGVDVFLVISGFVISGMLLRELQSTGTVRFRTFYTRRIKRLLPALALLTTVVVGLSIFLGSSFGSQQTTAKTGLGATYLSANVVIYRDSIQYFSPEADTNPLLHTWTLSVEEQVYLVFPALLLGSWMLGRMLRGAGGASGGSLVSRSSLRGSRKAAGIMLTVVAVPSFLLCLITSLGWNSLPPTFAFYSSVTRVWEFAIGAALALAASRLERIPSGLAAAAGVGGACAIVVGAFKITSTTPYPGFAVLLPVLGAAAIITSGLRPGAAGVPRLLAARPMVKIGDLSYSWYLWHWPLIVFGAIVWPSSRLVLVFLGVASLIPAWLSATYIENPIRQNKAVKGRRVVVLAAVCTLVPTVACLGLLAGASASWGNEGVANMQAQVGAEHVPAKNDCDAADTTASSVNDPACQWNQSGKGPRIYLVGNSLAAMYSEGLIGASTTLDLPLTIDTHSGCFNAQENRECDTFTTTVDTLAKSPPGIVVMSSTWDLGIWDGPASAQVTAQKEVRYLISGLTDAINRLKAAGHRVLIVLPVPRFFHGTEPGTYVPAPVVSLDQHDPHGTVWRPEDCSTAVAQSSPEECGATVPKEDVQQTQELAIETLKKIARATGSKTLDLRSEFCSADTCTTNVGDRWLYEDGIHISVDESTSLAPTFARVLKDMIRDDSRA